jgi:hypothetical protein
VIGDPELAERLRLSDAEFEDYILSWIAQFGPREFTAGALEHALAYPWERPAHSYLLSDDAVAVIETLDASRREAVLDRFVAGRGNSERLPLLAIGSNGAPEVLRRKFAHFPDREDRDVLVIAGRLHEFDVGAAAYIAVYGALPATLFPSPGTAVRAAILWLTERQFTQLVWTELSYSLGRLETRFEADEPEFDIAEVVAFVSRFGAFSPDGAAVALAAVPARGRSAQALTQHELLSLAGELALGPGTSPHELVRAMFEAYGETAPRVLARLRPRGRRFDSPRWTPVIAPAG